MAEAAERLRRWLGHAGDGEDRAVSLATASPEVFEAALAPFSRRGGA